MEFQDYQLLIVSSTFCFIIISRAVSSILNSKREIDEREWKYYQNLLELRDEFNKKLYEQNDKMLDLSWRIAEAEGQVIDVTPKELTTRENHIRWY